MNLIALGINHNSAALEVRERVSFAPEQVGEALVDVCEMACIEEVVILSTCNRTELYAIVPEDVVPGDKAQELIDWVANYHHLSAQELHQFAYLHEGGQAIRHLAHVASGLDSMVLGEPQIFGQLKSAYAVADEAGTVGDEFARLFPRVFSIAKRVRTDTAIGENPVSVAYASVSMAHHIFADMSRNKALLIGAGKTIELVARHLAEAGVRSFLVANRTLEKAQALAEAHGGKGILLSEIPDHLSDVDIVISSTASPLPILGKGAVERALKKRKHRPYFMVDIAVPRDIEPEVASLADVYLYTVDDLRQVIEENIRSREGAAREAENLISSGVQDFLDQLRALDAVSTLKVFRQRAELLRDAETEKALRALRNGTDPETALRSLARGLTNKLLHQPSVQVRKAMAEGRTEVTECLRELYQLDALEADEPTTTEKL